MKTIYLLPALAILGIAPKAAAQTTIIEEPNVTIIVGDPNAARIVEEELADKLDVPVDKIADTLKVSGRHISVDAPFVEGEDNSLLDVLTNDDSPMADATLTQESLSKEVDRALKQLHERERDILKMFFGIGCQEMTLEEIGAKFDLTRERVRQIKEKAIRRLKGQKSRLLKTYLGQ